MRQLRQVRQDGTFTEDAGTDSVEIGAVNLPDSAYDVEVVGRLAYAANSFSGLRIIDFGPEYVPEPDAWLGQLAALSVLCKAASARGANVVVPVSQTARIGTRFK